MLQKLMQQLPPEARILDYGCLGWKLLSLRQDLEHHGCDVSVPKHTPANARFHLVSASARTIPLPDDFFDLVVASHVLEHSTDPLDLFKELARVCRPGGKIYVETPSDRWLRMKSHPRADMHGFDSFWDDPTHIRPWTLAALYRLAVSYGCTPLEWKHISARRHRWFFPFWYLYYTLRNNQRALGEMTQSAKGLNCYVLAEKLPEIKGAPQYCYPFLRDVPGGVENAMRFYKTGTSG